MILFSQDTNLCVNKDNVYVCVGIISEVKWLPRFLVKRVIILCPQIKQ